MRIHPVRGLGLAAVGLCLALGTGGVRVAAADSKGAGIDEAAQCQAAPAPRVRTLQLDSLRERKRNVFVLNTRGYNYARPGELPALPPDAVQPRPEKQPAPESD